MPFVSVSSLGVLLGLVAWLWRWHGLGSALSRGLMGAWAGFLGGAFIGLLIDVVTGNGLFFAYVGHSGALAGAIGATRKATLA